MPDPSGDLITPAELLERARRDELLTVADLELLLAAQGTPTSRYTVRDWIADGKVYTRRIPHPRSLRIPGAEVLAALAWRRRVCRAA